MLTPSLQGSNAQENTVWLVYPVRAGAPWSVSRRAVFVGGSVVGQNTGPSRENDLTSAGQTPQHLGLDPDIRYAEFGLAIPGKLRLLAWRASACRSRCYLRFTAAGEHNGGGGG